MGIYEDFRKSTEKDLDVELNEVYKKMCAQARENGYYLIPKAFYERLFNNIDALKEELKRKQKRIEALKRKLKNVE